MGGSRLERAHTHLGSIACVVSPLSGCRSRMLACWFAGRLLAGGHGEKKKRSRELSETRIRGCPVVLSYCRSGWQGGCTNATRQAGRLAGQDGCCTAIVDPGGAGGGMLEWYCTISYCNGRP